MCLCHKKLPRQKCQHRTEKCIIVLLLFVFLLPMDVFVVGKETKSFVSQLPPSKSCKELQFSELTDKEGIKTIVKDIINARDGIVIILAYSITTGGRLQICDPNEAYDYKQ